MGHWEDFWYETHQSLEKKGLKKEFDAQLDKMRYQDKHRYKDTRDRWEYALSKVITQHNDKKKKE